MCGIAGFVRATPGSDPPAVLDRMTGSIRHRGPDGSGVFRDPFASLGHRRLSIIDVAGGSQPMFNEDGQVAIVYNGEIFNHSDLRPELEAAGHRYTTHCDTETIVHAYEQYGPACVSRFRGMFSFAIWNRNNRKLFCARDRLGIKPFYYYFDGRVFVFASEIKALLEHPAISARFEQDALPEYLAFGYLSGERTLFSGIRKLMPGHHLTVEPALGDRLSLHIEKYWDLPASSGDAHHQSDAGWIKECRQRLEETVRMRLMSDVPLGMFLSGGVDSSAIAALMKRMVSGPIKTFAVGYKEAAYSELGYARQVATHIGADHREVSVGMEEFFDVLPRLICHEDEPITWPSSVSLYFVSKLAAREVKVVLTGEGSDELFAGYSRYRFYDLNQRWASTYGLLPSFARSWIRGQVAESPLLSAALRRKLQHTFVGRAETVEALYLDNFYSAFPAGEQETLLAGASAPSAYGAFLSHWNAHADLPIIPRMLFADQKTYLVELL
ncbi:MAG: asparagine synthase (glutamine-hydrolyzing), partial [Bryobacteraceae bacterium]